MRQRRLVGWLGIIMAVAIIILSILYLIQGSFLMVIGLPVGLYMIVRLLPNVKRKA